MALPLCKCETGGKYIKDQFSADECSSHHFVGIQEKYIILLGLGFSQHFGKGLADDSLTYLLIKTASWGLVYEKNPSS